MRLATALYAIIGIINLYSEYTENATINEFTKPVLMPLLIYLLFIKADGFVNLSRLLLALALIFAWIGDLLLLKGSEQLFFLGGLGSFLIMQILYCVVFYRAMYQQKWPGLKLISPFIIGFLIIGYACYSFAGSMWIPSTIYALCVLTMTVFSLNRKEETVNRSFQFTAAGAALFVISDSLIGVNKFMMEVPYAAFLIMLTYIPAQYLIMSGVMLHNKH